MTEHDGLVVRFEAQRAQLRAVAYRMLGSLTDADDVVQETWLELMRVDAAGIADLGGWLRTVLSRACLDLLRSRESRHEDETAGQGGNPEREAAPVDSVGRALLVVLDTLAPAERVAFVLHDMFAVPFDEIVPIVGRSMMTTKKLASRARHRVHGRPALPGERLARHRRVVEAFLAASRAGDIEAVLAVLAPDVVRRGDPVALRAGRATEVRGARAVAEEIVLFGRSARFAVPALVNGGVGVLVAPHGRLRLVLTVRIVDDRIAEYELIADPARLPGLDLAVLDKLSAPREIATSSP